MRPGSCRSRFLSDLFPRSMHPTLEKALTDARTGNLQRALDSARLHVRLHPRQPEAFEVQALILLQAGRPDEAIASLGRAVAVAPRSASTRVNLASGLQTVGRFREAVAEYLASLAIDDRNIVAWHGLARSRLQLDDHDGAIDACRRGMQLSPCNPDLAVVLASALEAAGSVHDALLAVEVALSGPAMHDRAREKYLLLSNYVELPPSEVAARHRRFGSRGGVASVPAATAPDPDRHLRIGVLSGDLRTHAVASFASAIFEPAPADADLVVFSSFPARPDAPGASVRPMDPVEAWFRARASEWVEAHAMDDGALEAAIRARRIDLLLDLSAHTSHGRLAVVERRPAPVVVTAIGYPNTTGCTAVDWRVVDSVTDPPGSEALCVERLLRVDPCFLCFAPPSGCPEPSDRRRAPAICFGSFNLASKVSDRTVRLWAAVLESVPGSQLVLKSKWLSATQAGRRMVARFDAAGVDPARIRILAYAPTPMDHLESYCEVDIALDTTPYNGTTTTCEAMWMGVPVVTLCGDRHAARVGASLLRAAGLSRLVADDEGQFVAITKELVRDAAFRDDFRMRSRSLLSASALMDRQGYSARFHAALRSCWRDWCSRRCEHGP